MVKEMSVKNEQDPAPDSRPACSIAVVGHQTNGEIHWYDTPQYSVNFRPNDVIIQRNGRVVLMTEHPHYGYNKPIDVTAEYLDKANPLRAEYQAVEEAHFYASYRSQ